MFLLGSVTWPFVPDMARGLQRETYGSCLRHMWQLAQAGFQGCFFSAASWKMDPNQAMENRYFDFLVFGYLDSNLQTVMAS